MLPCLSWPVAVTFFLASATASAQESLHYQAPPDWIQIETASPQQLDHYGLPRTPGDPEDAELSVYYFVDDTVTVESTLELWTNQMLQPDGRPPSEMASTTNFDVADLSVTVLDVPGIYSAEVQPNSGMHYYKRDFRLKAAVVETPEGPYFFKLTGPSQTVADSEVEFNALLANLSFQQ